MKRVIFAAALALAVAAPPHAFAAAQDKQPAARDATREKLRVLLEKAGARKDIDVTFRASAKQQYNFIGVMKNGLTHSEGLEIVIGVTGSDTIGFRVYPHYKGGYINLDKARDRAGLMRKLLNLSDSAFYFFGADAAGDVFAGYTVTLESGFPEASINIVLASISNIDPFVGEMRPFIDNSPAPPK